MSTTFVRGQYLNAKLKQDLSRGSTSETSTEIRGVVDAARSGK